MSMMRKTMNIFEDFSKLNQNIPCSYRKVKLNPPQPHKDVARNNARQMIECECIEVLLSSASKSLIMAMILPGLLANPIDVELLLAKTPYAKGSEILKNFLKRIKSFYRLKRASVDVEEALEIDEAAMRLINYFVKHNEILQYIPEWQKFVTPFDGELLKLFDSIIKCSLKHLAETAEYRCLQEKFLHDLSQRRYHLRKTIQSDTKLISLERGANSYRAMVNKQLISRYFEQLHEESQAMDAYLAMAWKNLYYECRDFTIASGKKQAQLSDDLDAAKKAYETEKKTIDKNLRIAMEEKNKYLIQLEAILQKYDTTLTEKFRENLALQDKHAELEKEYNEFMIMYRREESVYREIVVSRLEAEKAQEEAKATVFCMNRAAIKIQRWWRKIFRVLKKEAKAQAKARGKGSKKIRR